MFRYPPNFTNVEERAIKKEEYHIYSNIYPALFLKPYT